MAIERLEWLTEKHLQGAMHFVLSNASDLKEVGHYEHCLILAYMGDFGRPQNLSSEELLQTFRFADKVRLVSLTDPLPSDWPIRLYRGISGSSVQAQQFRISWTVSLDVACFFALKYNFTNPQVLVAEVNEDEVFCHSNKRQEQEFVAIPKTYAVLEISLSEMTMRSDREKASIQMRNAAYVQELRAAGVRFEGDC